MNIIVKLEETALFILGIYLFRFLSFEWWWFFVLILAPDLSMLGYILGNKSGAFFYNVFHHKGFAVLCYILGSYFISEDLQLAGIILFSHSAMDRIFGYGLKYEKGFRYTHLGEIGK
ncbi:DUF4260 domain-containing protein [Flavobacterium limi]|nr:DUF4260 domain-containing protein [Flavobacterium limi]